ncbi:YheC/YheD family protein [Paenibacillus cremeus]|uniref:YheC/YheD family protein n=1 Tax=Paenibacillus cremeus TaxID=2163881 RepID=A0A559JZS6_9BACL|nr:hypothetical protein FPZ49_30550 [Paenibacillus cremeus]
MRGSKKLVSFLPDTQRLTKQALWKLLQMYGKVMLKPSSGSLGKDVIQVTSIPKNRFELHAQKRIITLKGKKVAYAYLKKLMVSDRYTSHGTTTKKFTMENHRKVSETC